MGGDHHDAAGDSADDPVGNAGDDPPLGPERRAVVAWLKRLAALTPGTSGNLSARRGDRVAVTPTGIAYDRIGPADVPVLDIDSAVVVWGEREPTSEVPLHLSVYDAIDAGAVAHVHSPWATTLAVSREPLPAVHYALARAGGAVPVADYATYGSDELAANAAATMAEAGTSAVLLANHGVVAAGEDVGDAVETAESVEFVAKLYGQARSMGAEPEELDSAEIERVAGKFDEYGQDE